MSEELTEFQKEYIQSLLEEEKEELANHSAVVKAFKEYMLQFNVILEDSNFKFYRTSGIIATYPNIISLLHADLISDKEGLLDFQKLCNTFDRKPWVTGYLYAKNFMLMAHPYFRRGFHDINHFAPRFVELFWNFTNPKVESFIALDTNQVRINVDDNSYMELDTWYGANFNKEIGSIPDDLVKIRPPLDLENAHIRFFFFSAYSLDIKWETKKGNIKSFQAEEFKMDDVKINRGDTEYFPVRYLHAEYDLENKYFRHFDGAIHFYNETEYFKRRDSDFNHNDKSQSHIKPISEKLFKLNGVISTEVWIEFSCHFFTGNPLIFEYFEGRYPKYILEMIKKVRLRSEQKEGNS